MIFDILINNILPLYGLIFLGYIVAKCTELDVKPIATLMLYAILPIVMFGATATMAFSIEYIIPPLLIASISILASVLAYYGAGYVWGMQDTRRNVLALMSVSSNATYFGVPIALALAGKNSLGIYMMMVLPLFILDCTLAYYYGTRGQFTIKESLRKVAKLPIIYSALAGILVNSFGIELPQLMLDYWERFTGTIIILGMMMIGVALAQMDKLRFDKHFFGAVVIVRYIIWPLLGIACVLLDRHFLQMLSVTVHTLSLIHI